MDQDAVLMELDGRLATITLNRPAVLNAMNLALVESLDAVATQVAAEQDVQVVLIRGAGRAFCAGLDLDMMSQEGMPPGFYETQERALRTLETMDKIVVAMLHGHCLGGGLQIAIACDIRICSTDARLGIPAVLEGLPPGMAPVRLPRLIGLGPARRLILSGEVITPEEALRLGLIDYLIPAHRVEAGLAEVLERFLEAPRTASAASKRLMARAFEAPFDELYQASLPLLTKCLASPEVEAAKVAWRDRKAKRSSAWEGPNGPTTAESSDA